MPPRLRPTVKIHGKPKAAPASLGTSPFNNQPGQDIPSTPDETVRKALESSAALRAAPAGRTAAGSAMAIAIFVAIFVSFTVFGLGFAGWTALVEVRGPDSCGIRRPITPNYYRFPVFPSESRYAYKYDVHYLFNKDAEHYAPGQSMPTNLTGTPVLFIPGTGGDKAQARHLAAEAAAVFTSTPLADFHDPHDPVNARIKESKPEHPERPTGRPRHFDIFTLDVEEELSGVDGTQLWSQAEFVNVAIAKILEQYRGVQADSLVARWEAAANGEDPGPDDPNAIPDSVILFGHSMGGVVARGALAMPNYVPGSVRSIFTMSSPHAGPPFPVSAALEDFYATADSIWTSKKGERGVVSDDRFSDLVLVSLSGGFDDEMIRAELTDLSAIVPAQQSISSSTVAIANYWGRNTHNSIVECSPVLRALMRGMYDMLDLETGKDTEDVPTKLAALAPYIAPHNPASVWPAVKPESSASLNTLRSLTPGAARLAAEGLQSAPTPTHRPVPLDVTLASANGARVPKRVPGTPSWPEERNEAKYQDPGVVLTLERTENEPSTGPPPLSWSGSRPRFPAVAWDVQSTMRVGRVVLDHWAWVSDMRAGIDYYVYVMKQGGAVFDVTNFSSQLPLPAGRSGDVLYAPGSMVMLRPDIVSDSKWIWVEFSTAAAKLKSWPRQFGALMMGQLFSTHHAQLEWTRTSSTPSSIYSSWLSLSSDQSFITFAPLPTCTRINSYRLLLGINPDTVSMPWEPVVLQAPTSYSEGTMWVQNTTTINQLRQRKTRALAPSSLIRHSAECHEGQENQALVIVGPMDVAMSVYLEDDIMVTWGETMRTYLFLLPAGMTAIMASAVLAQLRVFYRRGVMPPFMFALKSRDDAWTIKLVAVVAFGSLIAPTTSLIAWLSRFGLSGLPDIAGQFETYLRVPFPSWGVLGAIFGLSMGACVLMSALVQGLLSLLTVIRSWGKWTVVSSPDQHHPLASVHSIPGLVVFGNIAFWGSPALASFAAICLALWRASGLIISLSNMESADVKKAGPAFGANAAADVASMTARLGPQRVLSRRLTTFRIAFAHSMICFAVVASVGASLAPSIVNIKALPTEATSLIADRLRHWYEFDLFTVITLHAPMIIWLPRIALGVLPARRGGLPRWFMTFALNGAAIWALFRGPLSWWRLQYAYSALCVVFGADAVYGGSFTVLPALAAKVKPQKGVKPVLGKTD